MAASYRSLLAPWIGGVSAPRVTTSSAVIYIDLLTGKILLLKQL